VRHHRLHGGPGGAGRHADEEGDGGDGDGVVDGWQQDGTSALPPGGTGTALLAAHPATCDAVAGLLGCKDGWATATTGTAPAGATLANRHPATARALDSLLASP
ncbi:hypothetical protein ACWDUG_33355, partial [Streptomyces cellulosae]